MLVGLRDYVKEKALIIFLLITGCFIDRDLGAVSLQLVQWQNCVSFKILWGEEGIQMPSLFSINYMHVLFVQFVS